MLNYKIVPLYLNAYITLSVFLLILLTLLPNYSFAQKPNISYPTPQYYSIFTPIAPLIPTNTGGSVPQVIYGQVSDFYDADLGVNVGLTSDDAGNIYTSERDHNIVRKITPQGVSSIFAGTFRAPGVPVGPIDQPFALTFYAGNIYVSSSVGFIKKITPDGTVTTYAGTGTQGNTDGPVAQAQFALIYGLAADAAGNIYVADGTNVNIRKVTTTGIVSTLAGSTTGFANGIGSAAKFGNPIYLCVDAAGNVYVTDIGVYRIRKVTQTGEVTTFAGNGVNSSVNGTGTGASLNSPWGIVLDKEGTAYVTEYENNDIKKITPSGQVTTFAGTGAEGTTNGDRLQATFTEITAITIDPSGNLYTCVTGGIRKITTTGYSIDKQLPSGLIFDSPTGTISGTPINTWPPTEYTITGHNAAGTSSAVVKIQVDATMPQTITFSAFPAKTTCSPDFAVGAISNNLTIPLVYTSSDPSVATVSAAGIIHIIGPGVATITVNQPGNALYSPAAQKQQTLVVAQNQPTITISSNNNSICTGMPVTFTATVNDGGTNPIYQWQINGANVGTNSPSLTVAVTATDMVQCYVINTECLLQATSNALTNIINNQPVTPAVTIQSSATGAVCSGTSITFTATPVNGGVNPSYQWQVNGFNTGTNSPVFTTSNLADQDMVSCTLTNTTDVCVTTSVAASNIINANITTPVQTPAVTISASDDHVYPGTALTFTATPVTAAPVITYQWQVNSINAGTNDPVFTSSALNNGDIITCTIAIGAACVMPVTSSPLTVNILPPPTITVPTAFTPNGDGINDTWQITDLLLYPNCLVKVYNRYGALVYQSKGYAKDWDGSANGRPLSMGTYYYIIDMSAHHKARLSGSISLIR